MDMRHFGLVVSFVLFSFAVEASQQDRPLIIVSDIDDTIQKSRIHFGYNVLDFLVNVLKSHDSFIGIPALFSLLEGDRVTRTYFVTAAPSFLGFLGKKFIQSSGFSSTIRFRPRVTTSAYDFKVETISKLIDANPNAEFLLFGDNGQYDTLVYREIQRRYGDRVLRIFIHQIYDVSVGRRLEASQTPYWTAADLAMELNHDGLISDAALKVVLERVSSGISSHSKSIRNRTYPTFGVMNFEIIEEIEKRSSRLSDSDASAFAQAIVQGLRQRVAQPKSWWARCRLTLQGLGRRTMI